MTAEIEAMQPAVERPGAARPQDVCFMRAILEISRQALGTTAPNPCVGAMLVGEGRVLGRAVTRPGGRPHAEVLALAQAGTAARGATLYVTLEPCGRRSSGRFGPSCTEAILAAGVGRVVVAADDPSVFAAGVAFERMSAAGIEVVTGVLRETAYRLNLGHFRRTVEKRPLVTLKLAQTADGFAAGPSGSARLMITGVQANRRVQRIRATHDAVMVGVETVREDDPRLNVRLDLLPPRRQVRIVLDTELSLPPTARLVRTAASAPVWVMGASDAPRERKALLENAGLRVVEVLRGGDRRLDLRDALAKVAELGLTRVLSEGGPSVASALLTMDLVDEVALFTGPVALRYGRPALTRDSRAALENEARFRRSWSGWVGADRLDLYERQI